ncbi:Retrovirus-related Pol poly from transposon [Labeo rohita]|uniref:Retrovirus-related Pol poly from transposon n=1 Tax=Labeo rohita TaxID=84645 RepID=A0A498NW13_LABRO|nr:Retrovirus-related Pol poly from transposon [Labeo rohita]
MFKKEVRYVGRLVSAEGVRIDPKDLDAVQASKAKKPTTVGEIRKMLGFLSYYRSYVQDFSRIAKPIYDLLQVKRGTEPIKTKSKADGKKMFNYHHEHLLSGRKNIKRYCADSLKR